MLNYVNLFQITVGILALVMHNLRRKELKTHAKMSGMSTAPTHVLCTPRIEAGPSEDIAYMRYSVQQL